MLVTSPVEAGRSSSLRRRNVDEADHVERILEDESTGTRKVRLGENPTPDLASPFDGQRVEVGVGDEPSVGALPATDMNGSDSLRVFNGGVTNLHGQQDDRREYRAVGISERCPLRNPQIPSTSGCPLSTGRASPTRVTLSEASGRNQTAR